MRDDRYERDYNYFQVKIRDEVEKDISNKNFIKAKNYYFEDKIENLFDKFLEENRDRGVDINKNDIIVIGYYKGG